jgi:SAM-dependent methyltransferase
MESISTANSLAVQRGLTQRAVFRVVDATERLSFPDASFDAITCIDAINHLPNRPHVIAEWARLLKQGGRLLFTDPITVTGPLTNAEIAVRSSIGFFLFVPPNYDEHVVAACGLRLLGREDGTANMAEVAERRGSARASRSTALREIEGDHMYEGQQEFHRLTLQHERQVFDVFRKDMLLRNDRDRGDSQAVPAFLDFRSQPAQIPASFERVF